MVHLIDRNGVRCSRLNDQANSLWNKACCRPEWADFPDECGATFWKDLSDPADADQGFRERGLPGGDGPEEGPGHGHDSRKNKVIYIKFTALLK